MEFSRARILVLVAGSAMREQIRDTLAETELASEIVICKSLEEAKQHLSTNRFDLLLTDNLDHIPALQTHVTPAPFIVPVLSEYDPDVIHQASDLHLRDYLLLNELDTIALNRTVRFALYEGEYFADLMYDMLENSADGMIVLNDDGEVLFANKAATELFRRSRGDLEFLRLGVPILTNRPQEIDIIHDDGTIAIAEMRTNQINWRGHPAYLAALRDMTERKHMEEALREAEAMSRSILNALQMNIAVVDQNGVIVRTNEAWDRFARENGDPDLEHTGVGINYFDVIRGDAANGKTPKSLRGMLAVLNGEKPYFELKYPCHAPHEERWFLMRVTPYGDDQLRGLVISHINITIQHNVAEQEMEKAIRMERSKSYEREMEAFEAMSKEDATQLNNMDVITDEGTMYEQYSQIYGDMLEKTLDERAYKVEHNVSLTTRQLAAELGKRSAKPRDLVKMHIRVLNQKKKDATTPARQMAYVEEGRLLILELMGYLASFYRDTLIADLELRNM